MTKKKETKPCFYQIFIPKYVPQVKGKGDCKICKKHPDNIYCLGYIGINIYEFEVGDEPNMPKCVRCSDVLPPQLMVPVRTDPTGQATQCIFCEREIKEVTLEKEGKVEKYSKEQAKKDYVMFLKQLKEKSEVAKILTKGK